MQTNIIELKKAMLECGIPTKKEFARRCNLSRATVTNVLNGKQQPSTEVMYKMVETLRITPERAGEIFFGTDLRAT